MADTDEKAYAAVEEALRKNPDASLDELWEAAKSASPAVGKLSRRQFNAKYPLQIKRRMQREAGGGRGRRGGAKKATKKRAAKKAAAKKRGGRKRTAAAEAGAEAAATPTKRRGRPRGGAKKATKKRGARKGGRRAAAPAASAAAGGSVDREAIRQEFLNFANELVSAGDQPKSLVKVISGVDKYVDRVSKSMS